MSDKGHHCPFLNRADSRCAEHFNLDALGHAFDYCFGYYDACAVYSRLLAERHIRRAAGPGPFEGSRLAEFDILDGEGEDALAEEFEHARENTRENTRAPLIQLTVGRRAVSPRHPFNHAAATTDNRGFANSSRPLAG